MTKFIFIELSRKKSIRPRKIVFEANHNNLSESLLKHLNPFSNKGIG